MRASARITAGALALALAGCSSAPSSPKGDGGFGTDPLTVATSDMGTLHLELHSSPQPPTQGTDTVEILVTQDGGAPVDGLTLSVVPWMPAMDHGTSTPTVTATGGGRYVVGDLYFYMAGTWELQTGFSGPVTDHVVASFQVR